MRVSLRKTRTFSVHDDTLRSEEGNLVVWWYGPVVKNTRAQSVPKAIVFFRRLDQAGYLGRIVRRETALTHLGLLRIGTIWNRGVSNARIALPTKTFQTSFSSEGWRIISPYQLVRERKEPNPISGKDYRLYFSPDRNFLLDFSLPDGRNLLIPCIEYFVRCYGRSAEAKRVLATYPWHEAEKRLFGQITEKPAENTWPIKLGKRMYNDDVYFLAHVLYDQFAQRAAKSVYAQIESSFQANEPYAFLKIAPWFLGPAKLKVSGIKINEGRTFLGLSILGSSLPPSNTIVRDREMSNKTTDMAESGTTGGQTRAFPTRRLDETRQTVELTDDDEPDHSGSAEQIEEDPFSLIGPTPKVIDRRHPKRDGETPRLWSVGNDNSFSTGEPFGSDKGVGHASIHATSVMESEGVLRDMWNAALHWQKSRPDVLKQIHWFTFEDSFSHEIEPKLISLDPFSTDEANTVDSQTQKWVYYNFKEQIARGVLILRIITELKTVYLFEVQRRTTMTTAKDGFIRRSEESFKGLVFELNEQDELIAWLRALLSNIRRARGIVQKLTVECPGHAYSFKHSSAQNEQVACEAAIKNALRKVDVKL